MKGALPGIWAAAVLAVSTVPLAAGYAAWWALPVLVGCVIVPTAVAALGRWARLGAGWIGIGVGVLGVIAALSVADQGITSDPVWWRQSPGLEFLGPLIDAVPRLLTAPRPAPAQIGYLVPAALLTWLVALGVALAVSARGRQRVAPLVGAVVLHVAGALLTTGDGDPHGVYAAVTVAVLLLGWVSIPARRSARAPAPTRGGWLIGASAAVVVGALALTGASLAGGPAFEPRTLVPPPQLPAEAANPLPNVSLWNSRADDVLFTLTPRSGPAPTQVRLAVLPDFDGAAWTLDARLRQVGVVEEPDLPLGSWRQEVSYQVSLAEGTGAWLPSLGRATQVSGADVLMDVNTGVLVAAGRAPAGPVDLTATVDAPSDETVDRAGVPPPEQASRYLELPRLPAELAEDARTHTAGESSRWGQVMALADYVRGDRTLDKGAPSGSSYGRLAEFLYADEADGGQVGTTEQFAASLAVLARAVGIPSRLVVGFELADAQQRDGALVVTGEQARVWTEVYLARAGWLPVDPSPDSSVMTEHTPPDDGGADGTEQVQPPEEEPSAEPTPAPEASTPAGGGEQATAWPVWLLGGAGGLLVLVLAGLVAARQVRRARWRRAGARGAWVQLLDALVLAGRPARTGETPEQVVAALAADPGVSVQVVADRAQAEAFGPPAPAVPHIGGSSGGLRYSGATSDRQSSLSSAAGAEDEAWESAVAAERALRASSPRWRRLLWFCSPAVLRRRQGVHLGAEEPLAASSSPVPGR